MSRVFVARFLRLISAVRAARTQGPAAFERTGPRVSRRAVLGGLAAAACRPEPGPGSTAPTILILGAGLAGLNARHHLAARGLRATVLDARDRVGGRVITGRGLWPALPGLTSELGAEWVNSADTELLSLCDALGLEVRDSYAEFDLADTYWFDGARIPSRSVVSDLDAIVRVCDDTLAGLEAGGDAISYARPSGAEGLDGMSARDWFATLEVGGEALRYAELVTLADYGLELSEQSALNPISFFTSAGEALYDERYLIGGGNDQVPAGLAALYGDDLELSTVVTSITQLPDGRWRVGTDRGERVADVVICAMPFTALRQVPLEADLAEVKRRCVDTLGYGTNAKLMLPFSRRYWRDLGDSGFTVNDLFEEGWDGAMVQGLDGGAFATFRGGRAGEDVGRGDLVDRGAELLAQLETLWPGIGEHVAGDAVRAAWPDDPWVRGSYSCYRVGQWTGIGGAEAEPHGSLFFAGEHTNGVFQGYMEGAARSGAQAADDVAAWVSGRPARTRPPVAGRRRPRHRP